MKCMRSPVTGPALLRLQPDLNTPTLTSPTSSYLLQCNSIKSFSSAAQTNLIDLLAKEHTEELEAGNTETPQDLSELVSSIQEQWRIVDEEAATTLYSNENDRKVKVKFHCQDTLEASEEIDDEEEYDEEPILPVRFTVTSTKAGKSLIIECVSEDGEAKIIGVKIEGSEDCAYEGPEFEELDENLAAAFTTYLSDELLITSDVASFVAMYADYKEQMQYVKFLKDAQLNIA